MSLLVKRCFGAPATPRSCPDCKSEHIGQVPCGMTWLERMRSTTVHGEVNETRTKRNYWDDGPLTDVFGSNRHERKEEMLEETQGIGSIHSGRRLTEHESKVFFGED